MIFIKIEGADQYIASEFSGDIWEDLAKVFNTSQDKILFTVENSLLVHKGQEQTNFVALVEVLAPSKFKAVEKEAEKFLAEKMKNLAVHTHIIFTYYEEESHYDETDENYPLYLAADNMVKAESDEPVEDEEYDDDEVVEEPYMGNIFQELDEYVAAHPEMSQEEATIEYYKSKRK